MTKQLTLIDGAKRYEWRLDRRTREVGREGVARARAALRAGRRTGSPSARGQRPAA